VSHRNSLGLQLTQSHHGIGVHRFGGSFSQNARHESVQLEDVGDVLRLNRRNPEPSARQPLNESILLKGKKGFTHWHCAHTQTFGKVFNAQPITRFEVSSGYRVAKPVGSLLSEHGSRVEPIHRAVRVDQMSELLPNAMTELI
jgi:hypothetical protein